MDCLPDEVLSKILIFLPLPDKLSASAVSSKWRRVCLDLVKRQQCLVFSCVPEYRLKEGRLCVAVQHVHHFTSNDVVIVTTRIKLLSALKSIAKCCPQIKAISVPGPHWVRRSDLAGELIQQLLDHYGSQIECFNCSEFGDCPFTTDLPALRHISLPAAPDVGALFTRSPLLNAVVFTDLSQSFSFPKGIEVLKFMAESIVLEHVFTSPACQSLQVLSFRAAHGDSLSIANFSMPNLHSILFHGAMIREVMRDFLKSLHSSPMLQELDMLSLAGDDMPEEHWIDFFRCCTQLKKLRISKPTLSTVVVETAVLNCKGLQEICLVDSLLTDHSLQLIGCLTGLKILEITFNRPAFTETGILSLIRGPCRSSLQKLLVYKSKGSFVSEEVRHDLIRMKQSNSLSICKLSSDYYSFDLNHPDVGLDPLRDVFL